MARLDGRQHVDTHGRKPVGIYYWRGEVTEILVQTPEREVVIKTREAKWVVEELRHRRIARIVEAGASPDGQPDVRVDTGCPVVDSITIHARR
jgi:hypothetical protein